MKILILGGTKFLGRHLIVAAQKRNHTITLFNRGRRLAEDLPGVETIRGDRNRDLSKLANRRFDAAIDTCGCLPQSVGASARFLAGRVGHYIFVSSISAYKDFSQIGIDETAPLARLTAEQTRIVETIDASGDLNGLVLGKMYGALKVLCEQAAEQAMPNRAASVRAGLIVGRFH